MCCGIWLSFLGRSLGRAESAHNELCGVCTVHHYRDMDMDMGSAAWEIFKKILEKVVVSLQSVRLFESNKLAQVVDGGEPRMAFLSPNKS